MNHRLSAVVLCLLLVGTSPRALWAFKPAIHADITREALAEIHPVVDGVVLAFEPEAVEEIVRANEGTDIFWKHLLAGHHVDDDAFGAASQRLVDLRGEVVEALTGGCVDGARAREALGTAFHTLQDFYAHSNWVELQGGSEIHPELGLRTFEGPGPYDLTCEEDEFTPVPELSMLTSGWFPLVGLFCLAPPWGKCRHGLAWGPFDCSEGLNKDDPNRPLHTEARGLAKVATGEFLSQILEDPRIQGKPRALSALLVADHDLVLVIDTTASMEPHLAALGVEISQRTGIDHFIIVTFGDPVSLEYTNLCDPSQLPTALSAREPFGGGGAEEPAAQALVYALRSARDRAEILLATDAPARDCSPDWVPTWALAEKKRLRFSTPAVPGLLSLGAVCKEFGQLPAADLRKKSLEGAPDDGPRWLDFSAVELKGRLAHEGLFPLDGMPIAGAQTRVRARFTGASQVSFRMVSPEGAVLGPLDLRTGQPDAAASDYVGSLTWPTKPFQVQAYGRDLQGQPFTETYDWTFRGQKVTVTSLSERPYAPPGGRVVVEFQVDNLGPAATFAFDAQAEGDARVVGIEPARIALERAAKASFRVTVQIAADAVEGSVVTLLATAAAPDRPGQWNYGSEEILVTTNRPPVCPAPRERPTLRPADGRMVPLDLADVTGVRDPDRDALRLAVISITQDEPVTPPLAPDQPAPDGEGLGQAKVELRAEREKGGNGRVYRVGYIAIDPRGFSCTGSFKAIVLPTGRSTTAVDDGQKYDSTEP